MDTRHPPPLDEAAASPEHADDPLACIEREGLQRRFALAGDSAASRQLFDLLLAYRLSRLLSSEGRA